MKGDVRLREVEEAAFLAGTVVLAALSLAGAPRSWLLYLVYFSLYLAMANMWNLLAGYSGLVSLCQPAFIGLAGYTLAVATWVNLPFYLGIIGGGVIAVLFTLLVSAPVFRLRGMYFAIGTLVIPEALRTIFLLWKPVGGELQGRGAGYVIKGIAGVSMTELYWLALAVGVASIFLMRRLLRARFGLGLWAIRDNERTAASAGVPVFRLKLYAFIVAAFITGLAGAIFYVYQGYVEPTSAFSVRWTMIVILCTVIGGLGTEWGPLVGTVIVLFLNFLLARYGGVSLLIQGAVLVGIMLLAPRGVMGVVGQLRATRSL